MSLKKVNNASYQTTINIGASKFTQTAWYITNVCFFKNPLNVFSSVKILLLKLFGAKLGAGIVIKPSVSIKYPWKLIIGDHCWIGEHVWIDNLDKVEIGNNVCLSQGAMLLTGNHDYSKETFDLIVKNIIIEDGVWIGAQAIVCPGIVCGTHAVLAVGSVATQALEAYKIYQGNPAVIVKERIIQ